MAAITLSVPDVLKKKMDEVDFINWSSVARSAFVETLVDVRELDIIKKVREISEIAEEDNREVREELVHSVIKSTDNTMQKIKARKIHPMSVEELEEWFEKP